MESYDELNYVLSPLDEMQLNKMKEEKKFAKLLETDLTKMFLSDLKFKVKHATQINVLIIGKEGTGRRTSANILCQYVKKLGVDARILSEPEIFIGSNCCVIKYADVIPNDGYSYNFILEPIGINYEKHVCRLMLYTSKEERLGVVYLEENKR